MRNNDDFKLYFTETWSIIEDLIIYTSDCTQSNRVGHHQELTSAGNDIEAQFCKFQNDNCLELQTKSKYILRIQK